MSGVLDRMAQRALGTLPAVQPLVAPRYSVPRVEPHGLSAPEMTVGLEAVAEVEAVASLRPPVGDARKLSAAEHGTPVRQQNETSDVHSAVRKLESGFTSSRPIAGPLEPGAPASQPAHARDRQNSPIESLLRPGIARSDKSEAAHEAAQVTKRSETAQTPKPTPKLVPHLQPAAPRREIVKSETIREERKTSDVASAPSPKDETSRHEMVRSPEPPKSNRAVAPPPLVVSRRAMQQAERQAAEEKSEVHISIGSIELRASRPEPRQSAAPFRPRVTLGDYLRRGQETRS